MTVEIGCVQDRDANRIGLKRGSRTRQRGERTEQSRATGESQKIAASMIGMGETLRKASESLLGNQSPVQGKRAMHSVGSARCADRTPQRGVPTLLFLARPIRRYNYVG